jgi:site-specific DNA-methyltransferase (adenine-specific)
MTVDLRLGDCLDVLPTLGPVDAVITDPVWPNVPDGMFPDVTDPMQLLHDALSLIEAKRVVIVVRNDSDPRFLGAVPARWKFFKVQILSYVMPGFFGRKLGGDEIAYSFGEPIKSGPGRHLLPGWGPKVQPNNKANGHPCARSLKHFEWLVNWWSDENETILDPFMGSGTTGLAAQSMGRRFIGIERDPVYFAIAQRRIAEAQPALFQVSP